MEDNLFTKIIDECAGFGCGSVHLHNFGEPLLDAKIYERIKYAKSRGLRRIKIFSNGSMIDGDVAEKLVKSGLDEIKVSFDGADKEEFEKIRPPLKFDSIVGNIKLLVDTRNKLKSSMKIEIACCSTSDKSRTMASLENCVDDFSFGKIHSWGDAEIPESSVGTTRKPCSRVWRTFTVLSDGTSSLCCLDYDGKIILGNLHDSTIAEIWKNPLYRRARRAHRRARQDEIQICSKCSKSFL